MPKEFQELSPNFQRSNPEILLGQRVEQLCMRLIVEPIYSRPRDCPGVKILVGQVRSACTHLGQQLSVAIQRGVEARLEQFFRRRRRCFELQHSQGADLWDNPSKEGEKSFPTGRRLIVLSPVFLVTRARKIVEKLPFRHAGLILQYLVFLQAPGNARGFGKKLADSVTVRTEYLVFVGKNGFQIQTVGFLEGLFQERNRNSIADEVVVTIRSVTSMRYFQNVESKFRLYMRQFVFFIGN